MRKTLTASLFLFAAALHVHAQYAIVNTEGYSPQIGALISMMDDLKTRVTNQVKNLDQEGTDFLLDEKANRIGALILHLLQPNVITRRSPLKVPHCTRRRMQSGSWLFDWG